MESIHSIIVIRRGDKYLNYFDDRWGLYMFPSIKGNDIDEIKKKYNSCNVKYLFDVVHDKYSVPYDKVKTYHHYFYEVLEDVPGEYFTFSELLDMNGVKEYNGDIIKFIRDFYE